MQLTNEDYNTPSPMYYPHITGYGWGNIPIYIYICQVWVLRNYHVLCHFICSSHVAFDILDMHSYTITVRSFLRDTPCRIRCFNHVD